MKRPTKICRHTESCICDDCVKWRADKPGHYWKTAAALHDIMVGMKMDKKAFAEWLGISFGLANTIFRAGPSHTNTWRAIFAKLPKQSQRSDLWDAYKADLQAILKVVP